jgi:hypothetical protein
VDFLVSRDDNTGDTNIVDQQGRPIAWFKDANLSDDNVVIGDQDGVTIIGNEDTECSSSVCSSISFYRDGDSITQREFDRLAGMEVLGVYSDSFSLALHRNRFTDGFETFPHRETDIDDESSLFLYTQDAYLRAAILREMGFNEAAEGILIGAMNTLEEGITMSTRCPPSSVREALYLSTRLLLELSPAHERADRFMYELHWVGDEGITAAHRWHNQIQREFDRGEIDMNSASSTAMYIGMYDAHLLRPTDSLANNLQNMGY